MVVASEPGGVSTPHAQDHQATTNERGWRRGMLRGVGSGMWWAWLLTSAVSGVLLQLAAPRLDARDLAGLNFFVLGVILVRLTVIAAIFVGATVMQAAIVRQRVRDGWQWILVTFSGLILAGCLDMAVTATVGRGVYEAAPWVSIIAFGGGIALGQWMLLQAARVPGAHWWIVACLAGLGAGIVLGVNAPVLGQWGTFGVVSGLVTATAITWLLGETASEEEEATGHAEVGVRTG